MEEPNVVQSHEDASGRLRNLPVAIVMAAGLLTGGGILSWFGLKDVSEALSFAGRTTGFSALVVALVLFLAVVAACDYWGGRSFRASGMFVLAAVLLVLIINAGLLAMQIEGRELTNWLIAWIALIAWSGWALWVLLRREKVWKDIPAPRAFAVGALATALLAFGNFAYSQVYLPYSTPLLVSVTAEFEKPVANGATGGTTVPLRLTLKNGGKVSAYVPQSIYVVQGQYEDTSQVAGTRKNWLYGASNGVVRDNFQIKGATVIENGMIFYPGTDTWLDPGETRTVDRVIRLPKDVKYQTLMAYAEAILVRKDRVSLDTPGVQKSWDESSLKHISDAPEWVRGDAPSSVDFLKWTFPLREGSYLTAATRRRKQLTTWWVLQNPNIAVTVSPLRGENVRPTARDMSTLLARYGLESIDSGFAEMPMEAVMKGR
ncbi:Yip1 family protein [Streptomyces sp. NPDC096311]|uniref:Yip1 family protein n=1 Tax=Streptomyces sp. NPDC096311 TaxID=3366083 RepID=UPI00380C92F0